MIQWLTGRAKSCLMIALTIPAFCALQADEGMWLLGRTDPKAMAVAHQLGLQLTDAQLYGEDGTSLKDCVVDFGDYCSGVIVSKDGLLFTNHHCGYRAIQQLSSTQDDILDNGFVARSREEERPVEGLYVKIWQRTEDITDLVNHRLQDVYDDPANGRKLGKKREAVLYNEHVGRILMECANKAQGKARDDGQKGIVCEAKAFYGGKQYLLNYYRQYDDVRLVFTVPQSLGKFGGDTDNWMWPRQAADFSVFRIYADSLGQPAPYNQENVPMQPKRWAQVSLAGYDQGTYCMTIGYPASTSRYLSSYGINERVNVNNIPVIQVRGKKQEVWQRWMREDRSVGIKYATKYASSSNYWKNSQGMNEAVERLGIIHQKQQREQNVRSWFSRNKDTKERFSQMFPNLKKSYKARQKARYASGFCNETFSRGIEIVTLAGLAGQYFSDKTSEWQRKSIDERMRAIYKDYVPQLDEEVMAVLLENYAQQVNSRFLPRFYKDIKKKFGGDYKRYAHYVFENSRLTSLEKWEELRSQRLPVVNTSDPELKTQASGDSVMDKAQLYKDPANVIAYETSRMIKQQIQKPLQESAPIIRHNENLLTQAVLEMEQEKPHYSDANFTQRMSFGIVSDYTNAGTHHDFQTSMPSLIAKIENGRDNPDYAMQQEILNLLKSGDYGRYAEPRTKQLPLCFLTTNDITGGNSGSPMFNGKGELIGLAFDGNWDALSNDISFDASLTRCIGVDIRFVLWLMEKWGHADHLIREINPQ